MANGPTKAELAARLAEIEAEKAAGRERRRVKMAELRAKRKAAGQCITCGAVMREPGEPGPLRCRDCSAAHNRRGPVNEEWG